MNNLVYGKEYRIMHDGDQFTGFFVEDLNAEKYPVILVNKDEGYIVYDQYFSEQDGMDCVCNVPRLVTSDININIRHELKGKFSVRKVGDNKYVDYHLRVRPIGDERWMESTYLFNLSPTEINVIEQIFNLYELPTEWI